MLYSELKSNCDKAANDFHIITKILRVLELVVNYNMQRQATEQKPTTLGIFK